MPAQRTRKPASPTVKPTDAPKIETQPGPHAQPKPKPEISVEAVPVVYYRPKVTFPDGRVVECGHRYYHEHERAGLACGRKIAALGEFVR